MKKLLENVYSNSERGYFMKVVTLFENRTISKEYKSNHGLSLYIETDSHKILFDTGTDDSFIYNAAKLGVNLEEVDIAIISHGHYDHGGGLEAFLNLNSKAKIYIGGGAFERHLLKVLGIIKHNIGLKKELSSNDRLIFVNDIMTIDNELILFGNVKGEKLKPKGNDKLLKEYSDGSIGKDDFEHEINLLITDKNKYSLFCGCAHKGIANIIERAQAIINGSLSTVVGGFHLMGMESKNLKDRDFFDELSGILNSNNIDKYYTCHCTGEDAYSYLKLKMSNLDELKTGMVIEI